MDLCLADLVDCLKEGLTLAERSRVATLLLLRDAFKEVLELDEGLFKIFEKFAEVFLVLDEAGLCGSLDEVFVHFVDGFELVVVRDFFAGIQASFIIGGQSAGTLGAVNLFDNNVFEVKICF